MTPTSFLKQAAMTAVLAVASLGAQAQTYTVQLGANPGSFVDRVLAAGTYSVTFQIAADFTAYNWYRPNDNGWRTLTDIYVDGSTTAIKIGLADPVGTPNSTKNPPTFATWQSAQAAIDAANALPWSFTTNGSGVRFRVSDSDYSDNKYGVTLAVTAVPEPSTYAMMFAGLGAVGFVARRRRRDA
jgi:hypothetical protein